jgi:hypothetical protein
MPDTMKRVRITTDHPDARDRFTPVVLVDGEPLDCVTHIGVDYGYDDGPLAVTLTLIGVDVDLEGAPEYLVKVIGPPPKRPAE